MWEGSLFRMLNSYGIVNPSQASEISSHRYGGPTGLQCRSVFDDRIMLAVKATDFGVDGGTLAIPTPNEPDHGKEPWPHVSA